MGYDPNIFLKKEEITLSDETKDLLKKAEAIYWENFDGRTWLGRCIFLSWYCALDCKFCFRSTQKHKDSHPEDQRRTLASVLLEALFCKVFNWRIEFLTGGIGMMPFPQMVGIMKSVSEVFGEKIWLNIGVLSQKQLELCRPYVKGICSSMETLNPDLHTEVCPHKPIKPYDVMFTNIEGFKKSAAVIVGLGEPLDSITYLFDFIEKHSLDRITVYALKPVRGTGFTEGPSSDEYLSWLASLRIRFPKLEIIAGTNLRRSEEVGYLMNAGVNAITKFPATKQFGSNNAKKVEALIKAEKRVFISTLTKVPKDIDWNKEIDSLNVDELVKEDMKEKIKPYIKKFSDSNLRVI
jgi:biotin synthase-like enzyme